MNTSESRTIRTRMKYIFYILASKNYRGSITLDGVSWRIIDSFCTTGIKLETIHQVQICKKASSQSYLKLFLSSLLMVSPASQPERLFIIGCKHITTSKMNDIAEDLVDPYLAQVEIFRHISVIPCHCVINSHYLA